MLFNIKFWVSIIQIRRVEQWFISGKIRRHLIWIRRPCVESLPSINISSLGSAHVYRDATCCKIRGPCPSMSNSILPWLLVYHDTLGQRLAQKRRSLVLRRFIPSVRYFWSNMRKVLGFHFLFPIILVLFDLGEWLEVDHVAINCVCFFVAHVTFRLHLWLIFFVLFSFLAVVFILILGSFCSTWHCIFKDAFEKGAMTWGRWGCSWLLYSLFSFGWCDHV